MLEDKIISYLRRKTGLHTSNEKHAGRGYTEYILIQRTGGGKTNQVDRATYVIQSISVISKLRAAQICEAVKEAMEEFEQEDGIFSCDINSDYDFTNTSTKEYRYQAVFDITYF